jgi:hypothetical protein
LESLPVAKHLESFPGCFLSIIEQFLPPTTELPFSHTASFKEHGLTLDEIHSIAIKEFGLVPIQLDAGYSYWTAETASERKQRVCRVSHDAERVPTEIKLVVASRRSKRDVYLPLPVDGESLRAALSAELSELRPSLPAEEKTCDGADRAFVQSLIGPVHGQYLRPWMTRSSDPLAARVLTVGFNPATPYAAGLADGDEYVTALLNQDGDACRRFHVRMTGTPSKTRKNIDGFVDLLAARGIHDVLQTNAVCYATPNASYLGQPEHRPGYLAGREVLDKVLQRVQPRVLVAFGRNTAEELKKGDKRFAKLAPCTVMHQHGPCELFLPSFYPDGKPLSIFSIRSFALPGYNAWHSWATEHLDLVGQGVERVLATS